jgi:magnesium transporter
MLYKELLTGLGIGVILAGVFFVVAVALWGNPRTLGAVAVSLFAASTVASVVALLLPWLLDRTGVDPAFGAGPLATVIQDLLSIVIYLWVALAVLE